MLYRSSSRLVFSELVYCSVVPVGSLYLRLSLGKIILAVLGFYSPSFLPYIYTASVATWVVTVCHYYVYFVWYITFFVGGYYLSFLRLLSSLVFSPAPWPHAVNVCAWLLYFLRPSRICRSQPRRVYFPRRQSLKRHCRHAYMSFRASEEEVNEAARTTCDMTETLRRCDGKFRGNFGEPAEWRVQRAHDQIRWNWHRFFFFQFFCLLLRTGLWHPFSSPGDYSTNIYNIWVETQRLRVFFFFFFDLVWFDLVALFYTRVSFQKPLGAGCAWGRQVIWSSARRHCPYFTQSRWENANMTWWEDHTFMWRLPAEIVGRKCEITYVSPPEMLSRHVFCFCDAYRVVFACYLTPCTCQYAVIFFGGVYVMRCRVTKRGLNGYPRTLFDFLFEVINQGWSCSALLVCQWVAGAFSRPPCTAGMLWCHLCLFLGPTNAPPIDAPLEC